MNIASITEEFRIGVDLMNVLFLLDEYTDTEPAHGVHKIVDIVIDALRNPAKHRTEGEVVLGEIVRQSVSFNTFLMDYHT